MPTRDEIAQANKNRAKRLLEEGEQLDMFGAEGVVVPVEDRAGPGRPAGAQNKLKSKLREYMAVKGYRDPAEQLAMLAGLDRPDVHPIAYAAQIAAELGESTMSVAALMRQASADVLPYWHAKLTPDVAVTMPVMNVQMAAPGPQRADGARRIGPPPMPGKSNDETQQDQSLSNSDDEANE